MPPTQPPARVGLLGGSFDPVHNAHLLLARTARDQLGLDAVWLVPAGQPWQRAPLTASADQRSAMLALAIADEPGLRLLPLELERSGPSYTVDTLRALQRLHPHTAFTLILGADQLANFTSWRDWEQIAAAVDLAVAARPGSVSRCPAPLRDRLDAGGHRLHRLRLPPTALSATALRAALANGPAPADLVPAAVARYIERHNLYKTNQRMDITTLQTLIVDALEDVKAQDIRVFDTTGLTGLFDRVIIASGTSNRQTRALAASVRDKVRAAGGTVKNPEGGESGEWVLVDCDDAVVHVMQPAIRAYYRLEDIWGGKAVDPKAAAKPAVKKSAGRKPAAKRAAPKPATATKAPAKKAAAKKAPATRAPAKPTAKPAAKSATKPATKSSAVKTAAKPAAKKVAAKKVAAKTVAPATKAVTSKPAVKPVVAKKVAAKPVAAKKVAAKPVAAKKVATKKPAAGKSSS